jgi:hypothetical protein
LQKSAARQQNYRVKNAQEYYGGDRREAPVGEIDCQGRSGGKITRNHYGCLVLNATNTLFIDVDVLAVDRSGGLAQTDSTPEMWDSTLDDLCVVLANERNHGFRVYRTSAGYRVLATNQPHEPGSPESERLMRNAGADEAFVGLCRTQRSFRARLTPKPWRCGLRRPPNRFPRHTDEENHCFNVWLAQYERSCERYATCRFLGTIGMTRIHDLISPIVDLHDRQTRAQVPLGLA